jgi:two-component sensor histidine kinase
MLMRNNQHTTSKEEKLLLKEIHHYIKNNFQMIIGLIQLQSEQNSNEVIEETLNKITNNIHSMGMMYEILYNNNSHSSINIKSYLQAIITHQISSQTGNDLTITPLIFINDNIQLNIETALPLGLIINELVTNSLKYAFNVMKFGKIVIGLRQLTSREYQLCYEDNGIGIPDDIDFNKNHGTGFEIIEALCHQINGSIIIYHSKHSTFCISFRLS